VEWYRTKDGIEIKANSQRFGTTKIEINDKGVNVDSNSWLIK
jgi:hypothetical protein